MRALPPDLGQARAASDPANWRRPCPYRRASDLPQTQKGSGSLRREPPPPTPDGQVADPFLQRTPRLRAAKSVRDCGGTSAVAALVLTVCYAMSV